ncbi:MAG: hypothetical protein HRU20_18975 [Pseudomonadales bacterium]|nr:hypothetical protein [Pseudomonadales bacterium]
MSKCLYSLTALSLCVLNACTFESDQSHDVPAQGLYLEWQVNLHQDQEDAATVVAMFKDGEPALLEGGDVMIVSHNDEELLLKNSGSYSGSYVGLLPATLAENTVALNIEYRPVEAREDRWYPSDVIYVDTGPTEFNGLSAAITFPEGVNIIEPQALLGESVKYTQTDQNIALKWDVDEALDNMQVRVAVSCDNTLSTQSYGVTLDLNPKIATFSDSTIIPLTDILYDLEEEDFEWFEISNAARGILQQELDRLSGGAIDAQFFAKRAPVNPVTSNCDMDLFLFRFKAGAFSDGIDHGKVYGSRSDVVKLSYRPEQVIVPSAE